jgi:glycosyltransferase involved in cell wall biosynthesis
LEILVINDGSKDNTLQILSEYAIKDKRITIINNEINVGLIRTLNIGVALANGSYIARMDADDTCALDRISILYNYLVNHPELDIVASGNVLIDQDERLLKKMIPKAFDHQALKFVSFFSTPIVHASLLAKSEILKSNAYDEKFIHSEDYELFSRLILNNIRFGNVSQLLYNIRVNLESVSYKYESTQIQTTTSISAINLKKYFDLEYDSSVHGILINRIHGNPSVVLIKKAFKELKKLRNIFFQKEDCSNNEKGQIDDFLVEQKIDILLQFFKLKRGIKKIPTFAFMLLNIRLFLNIRGFNYLKSKFIYKFKTT